MGVAKELDMDLREKIDSKKVVAGIVGLGYVGLPLAVEIGNKGIKTIGFNRSEDRVEKINKGQNYIQDVDDRELAELVEKKLLWATSDFSHIPEADVICIAVPTPITKDKEPDLGAVKDASERVAKYLKKGQLVILKSTTYPGTTDEVVKPILEKHSGLKAGKDFYLAFSPERIDPGNEKYNTGNTPKVVGGIDPESTKLVADFFRLFITEVHEVSTTKAAEMAKILENTFRLINISFINEMAILADKMDIDICEVIDAAKTKPFGFMPFYPGPGLGGHCIPVDPYYLTYKAHEMGLETKFIDVASGIDDYMHEYALGKIKEGITKCDKGEKKAKVLVLGAAYKKDIDDFRESPAIKIMELMAEEGICFDYYDPYVKSFKEGSFEMKSIPKLDAGVLGQYDAVVILTDHTNVDYEMVEKEAKVIVDTRNAIKAKSEKLIKL